MKILKHALRIILQMKAYSIICIVSLIISLAGTITLVRYIHQELTVDSYLEDLDRIYLLTSSIPGSSNFRLDINRNWNNDKAFIDPLSHPAVEVSTTVYTVSGSELKYNNHHYAIRSIAVDSIFHRLMPREAVIGSVTDIPPTGIVISKDLSDRIFGQEQDPIGKALTYGGKQVTVTGVMKPLPGKASFEYDVMLSKELHTEWMGTGASAFCMALLYRAEDAKVVNEWQKPQTLSWYSGKEIIYQLTPLKDNYFSLLLPSYNSESFFIKGDKNGIRILSFVALLLFIVGLFNYWNLYAVIMQKRGLEFGVRKVFGAGRWALFKQLYMENFLLALVSALFIGMAIEITDKILVHSLGIPIWNNVAFNTALGVGLLFGFPLLTTLYPYFRYLYKRPVSSMKALRLGNKGILTRSIFLLAQYVISFCLIIVSVYFAKQLDDMLNADLGFRTKNILRCILIPADNTDVVIHNMEEWEKQKAKEKADVAKINHELNSNPSILEWTLSDEGWKGGFPMTEPFMKKADTDDEFISGTVTNLMASDFKLYNLEMIEGRTWNDSIDRFENYNLIINESAKEALGITDIRIDQIQTKDRLWWSTYADCSGNPPFNIVGVLKDYRTDHLSKGVEPTIYMYSEQGAEYINPGTPFIIHYAAGKQQEVINFLSNLRNEISGEGDLEYSFLEDEIAKRYENDRRIVNIYLIFAGLAIAVSCLGLFGLSLFEIRLRYREIALRKVHGAKMSDIVRLVSKRYLWLLVASAFISIPLSIWFIHRYMEDYAYRTSLSIWIFLLAGAIVAAISAGVLFWQVHKAANVNPADVMKSE